jgi:hypothetical protein
MPEQQYPCTIPSRQPTARQTGYWVKQLKLEKRTVADQQLPETAFPPLKSLRELRASACHPFLPSLPICIFHFHFAFCIHHSSIILHHSRVAQKTPLRSAARSDIYTPDHSCAALRVGIPTRRGPRSLFDNSNRANLNPRVVSTRQQSRSACGAREIPRKTQCPTRFPSPANFALVFRKKRLRLVSPLHKRICPKPQSVDSEARYQEPWR